MSLPIMFGCFVIGYVGGFLVCHWVMAGKLKRIDDMLLSTQIDLVLTRERVEQCKNRERERIK